MRAHAGWDWGAFAEARPMFLGFVLLQCVEFVLLASHPSGESFAPTPFFTVGAALGYALVSVCARRWASLIVQPRSYGMCAAVLAGSTALLAVAALVPNPTWANALYAFSLFAGSLALAPLSVGWLCLYAHMPMQAVLCCFALASVTSAPLVCLLSVLEPVWVVQLATAALPLVSAALFRRGRERLADALQQRADKPYVRATFPWRPVILSCFVAFATTFLRWLEEGAAIALLGQVGTLLAGALLLGAIAWAHVRFAGLQQAILVVTVAALLCAPLSGYYAWAPGAAAVLSMVANTLYLAFMQTLLCGISYRYGVEPCGLTATALSVVSVGYFVGEGASSAYASLHPAMGPALLFAGVLILLAIVLFASLAREDDLTSAWGMRIEGEAKEADAAPGPLDGAGISARVFELSCAYGLTRREEEVCALLAQGNSVPAIERLLSVSNSTAKSHVAHIYKKFGVHSIDEFRSVFFNTV